MAKYLKCSHYEKRILPKITHQTLQGRHPNNPNITCHFWHEKSNETFSPVFNTVFAVASLCTRMYRMYTRERLQNVQHKVVQKKLIRCCILTKNLKDSWSKMWIFFNICQTQRNPFYQFAPMAAPAPTSLYYIDVIYHKSGTHCTKILFLNHEILKTQFGPSLHCLKITQNVAI